MSHVDEVPPEMAEPIVGRDGRLETIRRERRRALGLVLLAVPVGLVIPWFFVQLVGQAASACLDLDAGGRAGLFGLWLLLAIASVWAFLAGCLLAWKFRTAVRVTIGVAFILAICLAATRQTVPLGEADHSAPTTGQCGADGIPTWWPLILPHR